MSVRIDREELQQEYELERAKAAKEGHPPRPRKWVEADFYRAQLGRRGEKITLSSTGEFEDRLAAIPPLQTERRSTIIERAIRIARGLPDNQRRPILTALLYLAPLRLEDKIKAWLDLNPDRIATHHEIAVDIGAARESVTKAISRLKRRKNDT